jgi:hypothetical protein
MRFTIRDLLWLTVVAAVALGLLLAWWANHRDMHEKLMDQTGRALLLEREYEILERKMIEQNRRNERLEEALKERAKAPAAGAP